MAGCTLGALALLSLALTCWQWWVGRRFPLHQLSPPVAEPTFHPGVTLLKPLKGCDHETTRCLQSWFTQAWDGPVQILLGVAEEADPVVPLVRQLLAEHSSVDAQLIICSQPLGPNAKVSSLTQLEPRAKYGLIVISDADVWAPPHLLRELTAAMRSPEVGLANCFYALANPNTAAMQWEAVAINVDFWSQVLQSRALQPMDFALGAVMVTRRDLLTQIGGFAGLVNYLADDYQLGKRIAATGARIDLCPIVVQCRSEAVGWKAVWLHQLRWARTIRFCQPGPYFLSILSNATLWPLLFLAFVIGSASPWGWGALPVVGLLVRILTARALQRRLTAGLEVPAASVLLIFAKDLLQVFIWGLAFLGNRVLWRGRLFRVRSEGKLSAEEV